MILHLSLLYIVIGSISSHLLVDQKLFLPVDQDNFIRVFHGVNVSYKVAPYFPPIKDKFDFTLSFSKEDAIFLKNWGMNVIRLSVFWEALEPQKGEYSQKYFDEIRRIIDLCNEYSIYVLIDMHQDVANKQFCGEGVPDWAVINHNFPSPLPYHFRKDEYGYPLLEDCLKHNFGVYYTTESVMDVFQDLFENQRGIQTSFINLWKKIAAEFKESSNLFGYELINEPFIGNIMKHPNLLINGENINLAHFYSNLINGISEVDKNNLILFELTPVSQIHLSKIPGDDKEHKRVMLAYHIYCSIFYDPKIPYECEEEFKLKNEKYSKITHNWGGLSSFLTEFGAIPGHPGADIEMVRYLLNLTDKKFNSWTYWQYKYYNDYTTACPPKEREGFWDENGNIIKEKVELLTKPYGYKICGQPISTSYEKGVFEYVLEVGRKCKVQSSFFYLNREYHFKKLNYAFENCQGCTFNEVEPNYYELNHSQVKDGVKIKLRVSN